MIHIGKIKNNTRKFVNNRTHNHKTANKFLSLPSFISKRSRLVIAGFCFIFITFILLSSVSIVNSSSSLNVNATRNKDTRVITNFYYNQNRGSEVQVQKVELNSNRTQK